MVVWSDPSSVSWFHLGRAGLLTTRLPRFGPVHFHFPFFFLKQHVRSETVWEFDYSFRILAPSRARVRTGMLVLGLVCSLTEQLEVG